ESETDFSVVRQAADEGGSGSNGAPARKVIRFGLGAVKGLGEGAVDAILESRGQGGPFASLFDFCERVDLKRVNRRVVEALAKSGAFDGGAGGGASRAQLLAGLDLAIERAQAAQRDRDSGQISLFGAIEQPAERAAATAATLAYPAVEEWTPKQ